MEHHIQYVSSVLGCFDEALALEHENKIQSKKGQRSALHTAQQKPSQMKATYNCIELPSHLCGWPRWICPLVRSTLGFDRWRRFHEFTPYVRSTSPRITFL